MRWMKPIGLMIGAFALLTMSATGAAAQPTLAGGANGSTISIQWTPVPGATSYNVVVTGAASIDASVPASPTAAVATSVPPGIYNIRVRALGGGLASPFSNDLSITVGGSAPPPGGCAPVAAPTVNVTTSGMTAALTWGGVAGAIGFRLQVGTGPGQTQFQVDLPAGQTSYSAPLPVIGTFYARVLAGSSCGGLTPSAEQSFTIGAPAPGPAPGPAPPGGGNRTPDPPAGQIIQRATLGYAATVINQVAAQFNGELQNSCVEHGGNNAFLFRVVSRLRAIDTRWGTNLKRGNQGLSQDIITFNPTNRPDDGESQIYLWDIISNHCGSGRADPNFADVTDATWNAGLANTPGCSTKYCAAWTINHYRAAGFTP